MMPVLYSRNYVADLMELNEDLYHVYIDSHVETGGGRETVFLRQHERGIPLTLRENFSDNGTLTSLTEQRDIMKVENEFQNRNVSCAAASHGPICVRWGYSRISNSMSIKFNFYRRPANRTFHLLLCTAASSRTQFAFVGLCLAPKFSFYSIMADGNSI